MELSPMADGRSFCRQNASFLLCAQLTDFQQLLSAVAAERSAMRLSTCPFGSTEAVMKTCTRLLRVSSKM